MVGAARPGRPAHAECSDRFLVPNSQPSPVDPGVPSPCVDICRLDAKGLCVGCHRTIDEIIEWPRASEARRREILRELESRIV